MNHKDFFLEFISSKTWLFFSLLIFLSLVFLIGNIFFPNKEAVTDEKIKEMSEKIHSTNSKTKIEVLDWDIDLWTSNIWKKSSQLAKEKAKLVEYEAKLKELEAQAAEQLRLTNLVRNAVQQYENDLVWLEARLEAAQREKIKLVKQVWEPVE
jgi:chromosome segregation ATPase